MIDAAAPTQLGDWIELFPALAGLDARTQSRVREGARRIRLPRGAEPFRVGAPCESYLFMLSGSVRVQMLAESGREFVLYRVSPGETCILTTACLLGGDTYPASAVTEIDVEVAVLPATLFAELLDRSPGFRRFVFQAYGRRLVGLMALIEEVVFRRLDVRLADFLVNAAARGRRISATHYQMAVELGSAREVISRLLKDFERRGWVALGRGVVEVTAPDALRSFVASQAG
ncbi:MAG TPA: Crp/Fnr family transcriptional regulator [Rhodospirillales bacterium]|nr:Crp/Fnr family transcriptional regulator [Rhodospirillales bacterium]